MRGSNILILGVAYKRDVDDVREAPAIDIIQLLQLQGANVTYNDPYVMELNTDGVTIPSTRLTSHTLQNADCVVVTAAHKSYNWKSILENSQLLVDTRNATGSIQGARARVVRL